MWTLKNGVKYVQGERWKHQNNVIDFILVFLLLNYFLLISTVSITDFGEVDVRSEICLSQIDLFQDLYQDNI